MWLGKKLSARQNRSAQPVEGMIFGEKDGELLMQSASEYRELPSAAPYGVKSLPPAGETAVGIASGGRNFCLGVTMDAAGLQPGELVLFSSGGAKITLTPDGKILLEGQIWINGVEQGGT